MTIFLAANNASTTLASPISNGSLTVTLATGAGAEFPSPGAGQQFALTFNDAATGNLTEIAYCTARSGDTLTIVRGQEGTSALSWNAGDSASSFLTAGMFDSLFQTGNVSGVLLSTQAFSTAGAFTPTYPGTTTFIDLEILGDGASGGGAAATDSSHASAGTGGSAGAYARVIIPLASATGQTLTLGPGGAQNSAGTDGLPGAGSSFGSLVLCPGGANGFAGNPSIGPTITGSSGRSGIPTFTGSVTVIAFGVGEAGNFGFVMSLADIASGGGGASYFGGGGGATNGGAGTTAPTSGSGGGGAANPPSTGATPGGAGAPGRAIIRCYQ